MTCRRVAGVFAVTAVVLAGSAPAPQVPTWTTDLIAPTVLAVADIVEREYMDADVAHRVAATLRRNLDDRRYDRESTPELLATALSGDLLAMTSDHHLAVTATPVTESGVQRLAADESRADRVRRTNAGVQRVEVLDGNVGYLNLTAFWRAEEAREAIALAMKLVARADVLVIDLRENGGGSPETVSLIAAYFFRDPGVPLFDIIARTGAPQHYVTSEIPPSDRNEARPVFVLTSSRTFSAGEGLAYLLQEHQRVTVVGERTAGAANPGRPYPVNTFVSVTVPNGRVRSAIRRSNWEGSGVVPDVEVPAPQALVVAHMRAVSELLATATGEWRRTLESVLARLPR